MLRSCVPIEQRSSYLALNDSAKDVDIDDIPDPTVEQRHAHPCKHRLPDRCDLMHTHQII